MAAAAPLDPPGPGTAGPPCAGCGTTGGRTRRGQPYPARVSGARFGRSGDFCLRCYNSLGLGRRPGPPDPDRPVAPCARCGTAGGLVRPGNHRPVRITGARFEVNGTLCSNCYECLCRRGARAARRAVGATAGSSRRAGPEPASVFESVRYRAVRDAKRLKWAAGLPTDLTPEELDAVLPPTDSRAARIRRARRLARQGGCDA